MKPLLRGILMFGFAGLATSQAASPTLSTHAENDPSILQTIRIDGDYLQELASPLLSYKNGALSQLVEDLNRIELTPSPTDLHVQIEFSNSFNLSLEAMASAHSIVKLEGIHFPGTLNATALSENGKIHVTGLDQFDSRGDRLLLELKAGSVSFNVFPRELVLDPDSGLLSVGFGFLGDSIELEATADIFAAQIKPHFDLRQSVEDWFSLNHTDKAPSPSPGE